MNIARTRWHINYQVIEVAPLHIRYKLPDRTACHRAAPYDRLPFIYQRADAHQLYTKLFQWDDNSFFALLFHERSFAAYTKHHRYAWAVNISIHQAYRSPAFCQGQGQ